MTDLVPRLAPRSAGAVADTELLRVARTDLSDPESPASTGLAGRLRGLAAFRPTRPTPEDRGPVRLDR